jgi:UDP-N-acetylmuramate dehydrogenase
MEIKKVSLKEYSSLRIGGEGSLVVTTSLGEVVEACMYARKHGLTAYPLGEGTNVFFGESLESFLFITMEMKNISFEDNGDSVLVTASAGCVWDDLVLFTVKQNLWGIENLSYIPGTVGAAPVQNIGAYGVELKNTFVSLEALDTTTLNVVRIEVAACNFGYRDSLFKKEVGRYIILSVTITLSKLPTPKLTYKPLDTLLDDEAISPQKVRDLVIATRLAKLPNWKKNPNCGSFFKNPVVSGTESEGLRTMYPEIPLIPHQGGFKIPAAWLIEHVAGMKEERVGDVGTWKTQSLVIVNYGEATANDVDIFKERIQARVEEKLGILLEQEVNRIG